MSPFKSRSQEKYAFANPSKFGDKKNLLEEWMAETPSKLPEKVKKPKRKK